MEIERHYELLCISCQARYDDDGLLLHCTRDHEPSLLRTEYTAAGPVTEHGLFRHADRLPVARTFADVGGPVAFPAPRLGARVGVRRLWVSFSGYWPERGAVLPTATFKDLEAYTVLGRLPQAPPTIVLASAGNTAAAFAWACTRSHIPCLLVVPASAQARLRFPGPLDPGVRLVVLGAPATYSDAIACADLLASLPGHHPEGGVRNVGRRDGLGAVMLAAAEAIGELPDRYVQAVGSGTGALGAHEMARRLAGDGGRVPRLLLCQNSPFAPLWDAWQGQVPTGSAHDVLAPELTNANPPYAIRGGVRDALSDSRGDVSCADNAAGRAAAELFAEVEGIDVEPSVGIALATLADAVRAGLVSPHELVLLNVTGGGRARLERDAGLFAASPWMRVPWPGEGGATQVAEQVEHRLCESVLVEVAA